MITWLLNNFSIWLLTVTTVGGVALLSVLGCLVVRRRFPGIANGENNELIGVLLGVFAAIYGVLLAFVVFILWEDRTAAEDTAASEATSLSQIVLDAQALPPPNRDAVLAAVDDYTHAVSNEEWPNMRDGDGPAPQAVEALDRLHMALATFTPKNDTQATFYSGAVASLENTAQQRRDRLSIGRSGPLMLFEVLLVAGAIVFVPLTYLFGHRSALAHSLFVAISTGLVALGLLLMVALGQPFAGDLGVDPDPYMEGALAQFWTDAPDTG